MFRNLVAALVLSSLPILAQENSLSFNAFQQRDIQTAFDFWNISQPSTGFHSSFKPYLSGSFQNASDSLLPFKAYPFQKGGLNYSLNRSSVSRRRFDLQVLPLIDAELGYDALQKQALRSITAGVHSKLFLNRRFTAALTLIGGNNNFPFFLDTSIAKTGLIPEYGQSYKGNTGYAFADFYGYLSFNPDKAGIFNLQVGRDKHFVGDGYRSVLYSDFGPANPYLGLNVKFWRLQYNVWYNWMLDVSQANGVKASYKNKYGAFHYLSFNVLKSFQIGFFENVIWKGSDTKGVRNFDPNYLNPVIFMRPVEYSLGSADNSFIGFNMNLTLFKTIKLYGQLGLDEFYFKEVRAGNGWWANKQAWQFGFNYINAFTVKGLKWRLEYNQARPYTYTHGAVEQNYAHYGQPLAHPYGANFKELLSMVSYRHKSWEISAQGMYLLIGKDSTGAGSNVGQNIFLSYNTRPYDYGHYTTQGILTSIFQSELRLTRYVLPKMNLRLELTYTQRGEQNSRGYALQNPYFSIGLRSSIWNSYRDF